MQVSAALQESPWAGNDGRVLWVGVVVLQPHLQARKYWFRCLVPGVLQEIISLLIHHGLLNGNRDLGILVNVDLAATSLRNLYP